MSSDMQMIESALMEAQSEAEEVIAEIEEEMMQPYIIMALRQKWAGMTPEIKEEIKAHSPENYALVEELVSE